MKRIVTAVFTVLIFSKVLFSQADDKFSYLDENEVKNFGKPLVTALGIGMNTGAYHTAYVPSGFQFSIGIKAMYMFIPEDQLTFSPNLPAGYTSLKADDKTATIFGDQGGIYAGTGGIIAYPNGLNEKQIPILFPQATISYAGTELLFRYVPLKISNRDVSLFGVGLKHSISQYISEPAVDVALQVMYNNFNIQNLVKSDHMAFSGQVSKAFGIFTAYSGLQYESSTLKFDYDIKGDPASGNPLLRQDRKASAEVTGDNHLRWTLGGALKLAFLVLNADFSLGSQYVGSAGMIFQF
ncbi:MAG: DUF6588 family protein [Acidobacteriota bacterium]